MRTLQSAGMRRDESLMISLVVLLIGAMPILAHHSFAAEYDANRIENLRGTIAKTEWTTPHIHIYVDVRNARGIVEQWVLETPPPNFMMRNGLTLAMFRPGLSIVACGNGARSGGSASPELVAAGADASRMVNALHIVTQDGDKRNVFDLNGSTACALPK